MAVYNKKAFVIATLRKASYRHPARTEALKLARVDRNQYKCAMCGMIFGRKDVQVDHRVPIIDPAVGWTNFDDFINNLFCDVSNLQILCKPDHVEKTKKEREVKKLTRGFKKTK